ncbi:permease [Desulfocucumis palustris]|uniref:Permease n=1 Tax=Desulfocucumis palustris TaxID=1898651 RepID=A0A2L2X891_9FIRM|nr:EamA family transporter [Desulfocucumis palustris]GBF32419.1 permease [Desulfocucumis palustris]
MEKDEFQPQPEKAAPAGVSGAHKAGKGPGQVLGTTLVIIATICYATEAIAAKTAYSYGATVETTLTVRYVVAAAAFWTVLLLWMQPPRLTGRQLLSMAAATIGGHAVAVLTLFYAFSFLSAGMAILLLYVYPTIVTVLAYFLLKEPFTFKKILSLVLTFGGAAVILGQPVNGLDMRGVALALMAALMNAIFYVWGAKMLKEIPVLVFNTYLVTFAMVVFGALGAATGRLNFDFGVQAWGWLVFLGLVPTALALGAVFRGIQLIGPSRASIISTLEPAITALLGFWLLGELLTGVQMAGGTLILLGVLLQSRG